MNEQAQEYVERYANTKRDTWINWLIGISGASLIVILLFVIFAVPNLLDTSSNVRTGKRTDDISACRAIANGKVTEARSIKTETERAETRARNHVANLTSETTEVAIFEEDRPRLLLLRQATADARETLMDAEKATDSAAKVEVETQREYNILAALSLENPDEFLTQCKDDFNE